MRISRQVMFMEIAHIVAQRSTCFRLNVGAVITVDNRIVSIGYNGSPPGHDHCKGNACPGRDGPCLETIHAEKNALDYVPYNTNLLMKDLYVTDSPCMECALLIAKSRVGRLFFGTPYRDASPLQYLWQTPHGPKIYRVMPNGDVVDWKTTRIMDPQELVLI